MTARPPASPPPPPARAPAGRFAHGLVACAVSAWLGWAQAAFKPSDEPSTLGPLSLAAILTLTVGGAALFGATDRHRPIRRWLARSLGLLAGMAGLWAMHGLPNPAPTGTLAASAWFATAATLITAGLTRVWRGATQADLPWARVLPALAVGAVATLAYRSFYFAGTFGAGDAYWYRVMLADFLTQLRAGIFPVWIGQSIYAFNGSTAPLRIAPLFQHQGGLLDLITGRVLSPIEVCNAVLALNALGLAASLFACLRPVLPGRDWVRAGLTALVLLSPAILAPPFTGDQYMTFVALPWVPLVLLGTWHLGQAQSARGLREIAVGLAVLWWAHAPVAMWCTFAAAGAWVIHRASHFHHAITWRALPVAASLFLALGSYPFLSALSLDNSLNSQPSVEDVLEAIELAFPGNFLPVGTGKRGLSLYQPGYALLLLGLLALIIARGRSPRRLSAGELWCVTIPFLILPVPFVTNAIWHAMPDVVLRINNAWPMQRLMPLWAITLGWVAAAAWPPARRLTPRSFIRRRGLIGTIIVSCAVLGWSAREADKFSPLLNSTKSAGHVASFLPQNIELTRYSYAAFSRFPTTFSHGYTDPYFDQRLLSHDQSRVLVDNAAAVRAFPSIASGVFTAVNDNQSAFYKLNPHLHLEPDRHYALVFDWLIAPERAHLQIFGERLIREYIMPSSGIDYLELSRAFGQGPLASRTVSLWTDAPTGTTPQMTYIARERPLTPYFDLARFSLHPVDRSLLPVRVHGWLPYVSSTFAPEPAWLETPKMWTTGYHAVVNGRPVTVARSPDDLVLVPLEVGPNEIRLEFSPGWLVWCAYFSALFSGMALVVWALRRLLGNHHVPAPSPIPTSRNLVP